MSVQKKFEMAEELDGKQFIRYQTMFDPDDAPLTYGVAVYENGALVQLAFSPIHTEPMADYAFRVWRSSPDTNDWQGEQSISSNNWNQWIELREYGRKIVHQELGNVLMDHPMMIFRPRLALQAALEFKLIEQLPDGYHEMDQSTRVSVPGRLTDKKLISLVKSGKIVGGMKIQLEDGSHWDIAPNREAVVKAVAYRHEGVPVSVNCDNPDAPHLQPSNEPLLVVEFPLHRVGDPPRPWATFFDSRFLRFHEGLLSIKPIGDDEWQISQYEAAEAAGQEW